MPKIFARRAVGAGLAVLLVLCALGAGLATQGTLLRTDAGSPDWSRGTQLGTASLVDPIALLPEPDGGAHLVWIVGNLAERQQLQYTRVNAAGDVAQSVPLALPQPRPSAPLLLRAGAGALHLFYKARADFLSPLENALYDAQLSADGRVLGSRLLSGQQAVKSYSVVARDDAQGQRVYDVLYAGDDVSRGLMLVTVSDIGGNSAPGARNLSALGTRPQAQRDDHQQTHAAWFERPADGSGVVGNRALLYYSLLDPNAAAPLQPFKLVSFEYPAGVDLKQPQVAIDRTHVYIAWVQDKRGGKGDLESRAFYVSFPRGQPKEYAEPLALALPNTGRLKYGERADALLPSLAPVRGAASNYVNDLQFVAGQTREAIGVTLLGLRDKQRAPVQVAAFVMADGKLAGFQLVNNSLAPSNQPSIALDAQQHLRAAWLDSAREDQYVVRYATTEPQLSARWNQIGARDLSMRAFNFVWYELSFLPWIILSVPWLFLPLLVLVGKLVFGNDEGLSSFSSRAVLALAIMLHLAAKTALLPPLPADWALALRLALMIALPLFALFVMSIYLRRVRFPLPIVAYLVFAVVDVLTAVFIYLPLANA